MLASRFLAGASDKSATMRLVSYNILNGGEGRADVLAEILLAQRPDMVALVEADEPRVVDHLARRLSMDFIHAPPGPWPGAKHAAALLSRWPIRQTINHALLSPGISRSFLEAEVLAPDGTAWPIGVVHLNARATEAAEDVRLAELNVVLERMRPHCQANRPHLLCGDFNASSPQQMIDLARCEPRTQQECEANGGTLPRRAVQQLFDAGYLDTYAVHHDETRTDWRGSFTTQHPGQRVDYIFAYGLPAARVRRAWIEHDRLAVYASDHFPIAVEIE